MHSGLLTRDGLGYPFFEGAAARRQKPDTFRTTRPRQTGAVTVQAVIDYVYASLIERAVVPSLDQIADTVVGDRSSIARLIREAKIGKTLLLDDTDAIWMAGPFSARPTAYHVQAGDKRWFANCAWDALGIGAIVDAPVDIDTTCSDCGEALRFRLAPASSDVPDWIVHVLVPARHWYDDIGFT